MSHRNRYLVGMFCAAAFASIAVAGCSDDTDGDKGSLTVYSGRSEELVGPLIELFEKESGIDVEVLYSDSASLALQIKEEGAESPADVFFSQAPGPLGSVAGADMLQPLDAALLGSVPSDFAATDGTWVGVSGRVRVAVYDTEKLDASQLPASVLDLADPASELVVGIAPTNASFQDFVSAMRVELGDDATLLFLEGLAANGVRTYPNNVAVVEAVGRGEVDLGLVNHYYNLELTSQDASLTTANHFFPSGDLGSLVLVSGAAMLKTASNVDQGTEFLNFLLSAESQQFFAVETFEYPIVAGVDGPTGQPALTDLAPPPFDLVELGQQLDSTLALIQQAGLVS